MKKPKHSNQAKKPVQSVKKVEIIQKPFSWRSFSIKILILLVAVSGVTIFTDIKGYFTADDSNNHVRKKWEFFYNYTETKDVDVIILGNSHIITGIDPYILSIATSSTCFILGNSGTGIIDAWFQLGEALKRTNPKIVVLETYCINNGTKAEVNDIPYFQSFDALKDKRYKINCMPQLFQSDSWVEAWSSSIRNHSFLLTDRKRIIYNINNPTEAPSNQLDLGRFSRFQFGLQDSTLAKYDSIGSPVKGEEYQISAFTKKYLQKIMEMCDERNIPVLFLTVPMYYKHVSNYDVWKTTLNEELQKYPEAKWLDLQMPYDTIFYTPAMFENTYDSNQHLSNTGMAVTAYKLASFIFQNYPNLLPDRSNEPAWIDDFKTTDFFVHNQDMAQGMTGYTSIVKNKQVGDYHIREMVLQENKEKNRLILKITPHENIADTLSIDCYVTMEGEKFVAEIPVSKAPEIFNPKHKVYLADIIKEVESIEIINISKGDF